jgi:DNA-binding IclR family transcriptional regulator
MTRRRPCTLADIAAHGGLDLERARMLVEELEAAGRLRRENFGDKVFFRGGAA